MLHMMLFSCSTVKLGNNILAVRIFSRKYIELRRLEDFVEKNNYTYTEDLYIKFGEFY